VEFAKAAAILRTRAARASGKSASLNPEVLKAMFEHPRTQEILECEARILRAAISDELLPSCSPPMPRRPPHPRRCGSGNALRCLS